MRVLIVATRLEKTRILPRLANLLGDTAKWDFSDKPDENYDLVYYFPYLEMANYMDWHKVPIAAWFSHADLEVPDKMKIWLDAAKRCDVRLTSARKYYDMLIEFGPTFIVTPPLDTSKFKPKI